MEAERIPAEYICIGLSARGFSCMAICFSPRITCQLRDGRRVLGECDGCELMWDFARSSKELRRFVPGLPIGEAQYERLVFAISNLDTAPTVDEIVSLTLPGRTR